MDSTNGTESGGAEYAGEGTGGDVGVRAGSAFVWVVVWVRCVGGWRIGTCFYVGDFDWNGAWGYRNEPLAGGLQKVCVCAGMTRQWGGFCG